MLTELGELTSSGSPDMPGWLACVSSNQIRLPENERASKLSNKGHHNPGRPGSALHRHNMRDALQEHQNHCCLQTVVIIQSLSAGHAVIADPSVRARLSLCGRVVSTTKCSRTKPLWLQGISPQLHSLVPRQYFLRPRHLRQSHLGKIRTAERAGQGTGSRV